MLRLAAIELDIVFLLHAIQQLLDQFFDLAISGELVDFLLDRLVEQIAILQRLPHGFPQVVERLIAAHLLKTAEGRLEAGIQQKIRQRLQQRFHLQLVGQVARVFAVSNALHGLP